MESNDISNKDAQSPLSFKVIVLGDAGVGKSWLIKRAVKGIFDETYSPSIQFELLAFDCKIEVKIWDTCGQKIYKSLIVAFKKNQH
jgi:GTPase SAR1 family protein